MGGAVTETVFALGFGNDVVATDSTSVYPEVATRLPQVGFERTLSAEGLLSQHPTMLLATRDAGPPEVIEQVRMAGVHVVTVPAEPGVAGAKEKVQAVANALGRSSAGKRLAEKIDRDIAGLATNRPAARSVMFIYARGGGTLNVSGHSTAANAMIEAAGARNAVTEYRGYKPLTAECAVMASPEVILLTVRGLESIGGIEKLLTLPGLAETPAARNRRIVTMDDLKLLGFGPRTGEAIVELAAQLDR